MRTVRWYGWAMVAGLLMCGSAAWGAPDWKALAADVDKGHGDAGVRARESAVAQIPRAMLERNNEAPKVVAEFEPLLSSKNPEAVINAAIVLAKLQALDSDEALERMLTNTSAAVRYWGAQGLRGLMPVIHDVGGLTLDKATGALDRALKKETSTLVMGQILQAQGAVCEPGGVGYMAEQMKTTPPDAARLAVTATGLTALADYIKALPARTPLPAADGVKVVAAAAQAMSFAAQQWEAVSEKDEAAAREMRAGTIEVEKAGQTLINIVAKRVAVVFDEKKSGTAAENLLQVNDITGTPDKPGSVQRAFSAVPAPARIGAK